MNKLNIRLQEARKKAKLTQSQVAEALNVSIQAVSSWETKASTPDLDKLP